MPPTALAGGAIDQYIGLNLGVGYSSAAAERERKPTGCLDKGAATPPRRPGLFNLPSEKATKASRLWRR